MIDDLPAPPGLVVAGLAIDLDADIGVVLESLLGRARKRRFDGTEHDFLLHVLLARKGIDQQQQFAIHCFLLQSIFGTSRARSISSSGSVTVPDSVSRITLPSRTPRRTPVKLRRLSSIVRSRICASSPANRSKS